MKALLFVALLILITILILLYKLGQVATDVLIKAKQVDVAKISSDLQTLKNSMEELNIRELSEELDQTAKLAQQLDLENLQAQIESLGAELEGYSSIVDKVNKINDFCSKTHQICPPQICSPFGGNCYQPPCVDVTNCGL